MAINTYKEGIEHVGHDVVVVKYGDVNVAIECETCNSILWDRDKD